MQMAPSRSVCEQRIAGQRLDFREPLCEGKRGLTAVSRADEGEIFPGLLRDVPLLSNKPDAESPVNSAISVAGSPKGGGSPSGTGRPANLGQRTENQGFWP